MTEHPSNSKDPDERSIERQAQWLRWLFIWLFSLVIGGSTGAFLSLVLVRGARPSVLDCITKDQLVPTAASLALMIAAILTFYLLRSPDATNANAPRNTPGPFWITILTGIVGLYLFLFAVL